MIDKLKLKFDEFNSKKAEVQPKIDEIEIKQKNEIKLVEERYEKLKSEITSEINSMEKELNDMLIDSFEKIIMFEFDAKRSVSEYSITKEIKVYLDFVKNIGDSYPQELVEYLNKLINTECSIEDIAYKIDSIMAKFKST